MSDPVIEMLPDVPKQPDFFDDGSEGVALSTLDKPETQKRYTGEELEKRIGVRDAVVRLLAEGVGILRIARTLRSQGIAIGEHSILALRDRRPDLVAIQKKQLSEQIGRIVKLMGDSIEERLISGQLKPGSVDMAIMVDKKAAVDGEAGMIIEHRHTVEASADAFVAKLEAMRRAKVLEVPKDYEAAANTQKPQ